MICCENCFRDYEIRAEIASIGEVGDCPICGSKNVYIYDSDRHSEIAGVDDMMKGLMELYVPESRISEAPEEMLDLIENHFLNHWNIFNVSEQQAKIILSGIAENLPEIDALVVQEKVAVPELMDEMFLEEHSFMKQYSWEDFKLSLRNSNRFHNHHIKLEVLSDLLRDANEVIPEGNKLYRARISDGDGFETDKMGAPPNDKADAGRVNSKGISCLYVADKEKTAISEVRANAFDYVTVAECVVKCELNVVNLSTLSDTSPFGSSLSKIDYLINAIQLKKIERDVSKPMNKSHDSELDYLPTQYISDLIKDCGYDGVKYKSTFDNTSYNIAIFDEEKCKINSAKLFQVDGVEYDCRETK